MEASLHKYPKILLTRHGESTTNQIYVEYRSTHKIGPDSILMPSGNNLAIPHEILMDNAHIDCALSPIGEEQCKNAGKTLNKLGYHLKYIFVSPLHRTLETTRLILNEYSFSNEIKCIKVWPELKEALLDLTGIPTDSNTLDYPKYDMSEIKDNLWILETDPENKTIQEIKKALEKLAPSEKFQKLTDMLKNAVEKIYPFGTEEGKNIWERSLTVKDKLRAFIDERRKAGEDIKDHEILLVAHSIFNMYFLAPKSVVDEKYYVKSAIRMDNCQMLSYQLEDQN